MLVRKIVPKLFSLFQTFFSFLSKQKKSEWKVFSTPIFFICLYLIGVGGDEILKIYLAWPKIQTELAEERKY